MNRQILSNATLILPARAAAGSLIIEDGRIAEIRLDRRYSEGLDLSGQFLIPGIIDMHTDYLEKEVSPRPSAEFPLAMAFHMMDLRAISCGITTVLGAARISGDHDGRPTGWNGDGLELARLFASFGATRWPATTRISAGIPISSLPSRSWPSLPRSIRSATSSITIPHRESGNTAHFRRTDSAIRRDSRRAARGGSRSVCRPARSRGAR